MTRTLPTYLLLSLLLLLPGCSALTRVSVQSAKTVTKQPANVLIYLSVKDRGKPVDMLASDNFDVYENDVLLDRHSTHLELLPRDIAADGHTLLLLDLSGDISASDLKRMSRGAEQFVEKVATTQAVSVAVFDGSPSTRLVARFPKVSGPQKRPLPDLTPFVGGDDSRNLNGGIIDAVAVLDAELAGSNKPVQLGTLVTLVRGPDLAGRKSDDDLYGAIDTSKYEFYSVYPDGTKVPTLGALSKDGALTFDTIDTLPMALQELGMKVRKAWGRHYLVSYCSPARGGERDVRVAVSYVNERGDDRRGKVRTGFNSNGFSSGCGPLRPVLQAKLLADRHEAEAQAKAEAEAAAERVRAEEQAALKLKADAAQTKAEAARARARRSLEGQTVDSVEEEPIEQGPVVAPPSSGDYE